MINGNKKNSYLVAKNCAILSLKKKAKNVLMLDTGKTSAYADFSVICSATNERHIKAIVAHISSELSERVPIGFIGGKTSHSEEWALLDLGGTIVHIFTEKSRRKYDLEALWPKSKRIFLNSFEK